MGCNQSRHHVDENDPKPGDITPIVVETKPQKEGKNFDETHTSDFFELSYEEYKQKRLNKEFDEEKEINRIIVESKYIRDNERPYLTFSKKGIVTFMEELIRDSIWYDVYSNELLFMRGCMEGTPINKDHQLGLYTFKISKTLFKKPITMEYLFKLMHEPKSRMSYDTNIKESKIFKGVKDCYLSHIWYYSPIFFISERDTVLKRMTFIYNDSYHCFSTSIDDQYYPQCQGAVRIINYINYFKLEEDNENFLLTGLAQADIKMPIPEWFLNLTLPYKMMGYLNSVIEKVQKNQEEELQCADKI